MNELIPIIAVFAAIGGAILSVVTGFLSRPEGEGFKAGRFFSSMIIAVFASLTISTFSSQYISEQLSGIGVTALVVQYLLQGFAVDKGLAKLDS